MVKLKYGDYVWAKLRNGSFVIAVVTDPTDLDLPLSLRRSKRQNSHLVDFKVGGDGLHYINQNKLWKFQKHFDNIAPSFCSRELKQTVIEICEKIGWQEGIQKLGDIDEKLPKKRQRGGQSNRCYYCHKPIGRLIQCKGCQEQYTHRKCGRVQSEEWYCEQNCSKKQFQMYDAETLMQIINKKSQEDSELMNVILQKRQEELQLKQRIDDGDLIDDVNQQQSQRMQKFQQKQVAKIEKQKIRSQLIKEFQGMNLPGFLCKKEVKKLLKDSQQENENLRNYEITQKFVVECLLDSNSKIQFQKQVQTPPSLSKVLLDESRQENIKSMLNNTIQELTKLTIDERYYKIDTKLLMRTSKVSIDGTVANCSYLPGKTVQFVGGGSDPKVVREILGRIYTIRTIQDRLGRRGNNPYQNAELNQSAMIVSSQKNLPEIMINAISKSQNLQVTRSQILNKKDSVILKKVQNQSKASIQVIQPITKATKRIILPKANQSFTFSASRSNNRSPVGNQNQAQNVMQTPSHAVPPSNQSTPNLHVKPKQSFTEQVEIWSQNRMKQHMKKCLNSQQRQIKKISIFRNVLIPDYYSNMHKFAKLHALSFKPRQTTRNKPIIIFIFEGVLGDFRDNQLFMREDSFTTLRELQTSFQLIIVYSLSLKRIEIIEREFRKRNIFLSATYRIVDDSKNIQFMLDYSQIYSDFKITPCFIQKLVVIVTQSTAPSKLLKRNKDICTQQGTINPQFHVLHSPCINNQFLKQPICIVIPHFLLQQEPLGILSISDCLHQLNSNLDFKKGFKNKLVGGVLYIESNRVTQQLLILANKPKLKDAQCQINLFKKQENVLYKNLYIILDKGFTTGVNYMRNESTQQLMSLLDYSVSRARRKNFFKND